MTPSPLPSRRGQNVKLDWQSVTISSGDVVYYTVLRHESNKTPIEVCLGANAPVTSGSTVTCIDLRPGPTPSYTVQAYVVSTAGTRTWSLPASALVAV